MTVDNSILIGTPPRNMTTLLGKNRKDSSSTPETAVMTPTLSPHDISHGGSGYHVVRRPLSTTKNRNSNNNTNNSNTIKQQEKSAPRATTTSTGRGGSFSVVNLPYQLSKRLQTAPQNRAVAVARAIGRASGSYVYAEDDHDDDGNDQRQSNRGRRRRLGGDCDGLPTFQDDLYFFDETIDKALRTSSTGRTHQTVERSFHQEIARRATMIPMLLRSSTSTASSSPTSAQQQRRRRQQQDNPCNGYDGDDPQNTSELSDSVNVLTDSANDMIAKQSAEIICLRMAVKEFILEILDGGGHDTHEIPDEVIIGEEGEEQKGIQYCIRNEKEEQEINLLGLMSKNHCNLSPPRPTSDRRNDSNDFIEEQVRQEEHLEPDGSYELNRSIDAYLSREEDRKLTVQEILEMKASHACQEEEKHHNNHDSFWTCSDPPPSFSSIDLEHEALKERIHNQLDVLRARIMNSTASTCSSVERDDALNEARDLVEGKCSDSTTPRTSHPEFIRGSSKTASQSVLSMKKQDHDLTDGNMEDVKTVRDGRDPSLQPKEKGSSVKTRVLSIVEARKDRFQRFHDYSLENTKMTTPFNNLRRDGSGDYGCNRFGDHDHRSSRGEERRVKSTDPRTAVPPPTSTTASTAVTPPRRTKNSKAPTRTMLQSGLLAYPFNAADYDQVNIMPLIPQPISPHVRLKEEDLTLLETKPIPKKKSERYKKIHKELADDLHRNLLYSS
jgi:hypothetical protein